MVVACPEPRVGTQDLASARRLINVRATTPGDGIGADLVNPRNLAKLRRDIAAAGGAAIAKNGYVTAIDVLLPPKPNADTNRGDS